LQKRLEKVDSLGKGSLLAIPRRGKKVNFFGVNSREIGRTFLRYQLFSPEGCSPGKFNKLGGPLQLYAILRSVLFWEQKPFLNEVARSVFRVVIGSLEDVLFPLLREAEALPFGG